LSASANRVGKQSLSLYAEGSADLEQLIRLNSRNVQMLGIRAGIDKTLQ
jgi:hypothetical protein